MGFFNNNSSIIMNRDDNQESSLLYNKTNYIADIPFINTYIYEYDIKSANISALLHHKIIDINKYNEYASMDKKQREISIGLWIKSDKEIYKYIKSGILHARKSFVLDNNITDDEILSIKNDALFILTPRKLITEFESFKFVLKNVYSLFFLSSIKDRNIDKKIEIYFGYDNINNDYILDIKGINDDILQNTEPFWGEICNILHYLINDKIFALKQFTTFYNLYITKQLPLEYYKDISSGNYLLNIYGQCFNVISTSGNELQYLTITNMVNVLRDIYRLLIR